jgi:hypothetical protein
MRKGGVHGSSGTLFDLCEVGGSVILHKVTRNQSNARCSPIPISLDNNKKYAWNIIMTEFRGTVMSLMGHVNGECVGLPFGDAQEKPSGSQSVFVALVCFLSVEEGKPFPDPSKQLLRVCVRRRAGLQHVPLLDKWVSFLLSSLAQGSPLNEIQSFPSLADYEIIDLSFTRSSAYSSYFASLDKAGGFFYERWGDAPVRSIAAAMLLNRDEIWQVDYAGYVS